MAMCFLLLASTTFILELTRARATEIIIDRSCHVADM